MKTSVIEVHDMLSVWSVDEVEKRINEVPGVESVTVNYAAGSATVRYDETRLEIPDIKSAVRQRGYEPAAAAASAGDSHKGHTAPGASPAGPKTPSVGPATAGAAAPDTPQKQDKAMPDAPPPTTPKPSAAAPDSASAPTSVAPKSAPDAAPARHEQHAKDKS
jgi:P-type Cu2+ transporter